MSEITGLSISDAAMKMAELAQQRKMNAALQSGQPANNKSNVAAPTPTKTSPTAEERVESAPDRDDKARTQTQNRRPNGQPGSIVDIMA